jgi:heme/copper-type cytochrome/quinol oxidase subunit 1
MSSQETILIILCVVLFLNTFIVAYLLGKSHTQNSVNNNVKSFFKQQRNEEKPNEIKIDDKKVVIDIKTEGLEKKYATLGETKVTEDNISNSVNKLKNLKR